MKELVNPPIVIRAEAIDGIKALAAAVNVEWNAQVGHSKKAHSHALEIGRLICEFAGRAETKTQLAILNTKKNGTPKTAHCWVAEQLFTANPNGVSVRHMERCARGWMLAQEKGLPITTPLRVVEAEATIKKVCETEVDDYTSSPERLFKNEPDESDKQAFDPEKEAARLASTVKRFFYTPEGHPRFRTRQQEDKFAKKLNDEFGKLGIGWAVVPEGRN
jgi:hypothetical protein